MKQLHAHEETVHEGILEASVGNQSATENNSEAVEMDTSETNQQEKEYNCQQCGSTHSAERALMTHEAQAHGIYYETPSQVQEEAEQKPMTLPPPADVRKLVIGRPFVSKGGLKCEAANCELRFENRSARLIHQKTAHSGENIFTCKEPGCDMSFPTKSKLMRHR